MVRKYVETLAIALAITTVWLGPGAASHQSRNPAIGDGGSVNNPGSPNSAGSSYGGYGQGNYGGYGMGYGDYGGYGQNSGQFFGYNGIGAFNGDGRGVGNGYVNGGSTYSGYGNGRYGFGYEPVYPAPAYSAYGYAPAAVNINGGGYNSNSWNDGFGDFSRNYYSTGSPHSRF